MEEDEEVEEEVEEQEEEDVDFDMEEDNLEIEEEDVFDPRKWKRGDKPLEMEDVDDEDFEVELED
jgi:hypothetical protein